LPPPRGARRRGTGAGLAEGRAGTIVATSGEAPDPVTGRGAVAFAVELVHGRWRRRTMLRDATTVGFDVALDSGERVRIPPGICVLDLGAGRVAGAPILRLDSHLERLDPDRKNVDDAEPFPYHRIRHLALRRGDRIEVRGPLVSVPDPRAAPTTYRDPAPALLVPDGIPRLAILRA
jgi:hypothetical protein